MNRRKKVGASNETWGTPSFTGNFWDRAPSTRTDITSSMKKQDVHDTMDEKNREGAILTEGLIAKVDRKH